MRFAILNGILEKLLRVNLNTPTQKMVNMWDHGCVNQPYCGNQYIVHLELTQRYVNYITRNLVGKRKINLNPGAYIKNEQKEFMGKEERKFK